LEGKGTLQRIDCVVRGKIGKKFFALAQKDIVLNEERLLFDASFTELRPFEMKY